jgi:hypothetical protein
MLKKSLLILLFSFLSTCSYKFARLGNPWEKEGIKTVSIPVFYNKTFTESIETDFTNALRLYIDTRSSDLKLVNSNADGKIIGEIKSITLRPAGVKFGTESTQEAGGVPKNRLLASTYSVVASVNLKLIRNSDGKILWQKSFAQGKSMASSTYTDVRATSNAFIKESNTKETIRELSDSMMKYAVDSLLEEF